MTAILEVSPYRNAGNDLNFLRMVFNETQKDLMTDKVYYQPERSKAAKNENRKAWILFLTALIAVYGL